MTLGKKLSFDDIKPGMLILKSRRNLGQQFIYWLGIIVAFDGDVLSTGRGRRMRRCAVLGDTDVQYRWFSERDMHLCRVLSK